MADRRKVGFFRTFQIKPGTLYDGAELQVVANRCDAPVLKRNCRTDEGLLDFEMSRIDPFGEIDQRRRSSANRLQIGRYACERDFDTADPKGGLTRGIVRIRYRACAGQQQSLSLGYFDFGEVEERFRDVVVGGHRKAAQRQRMREGRAV